ncbi:MAG: APC family permease [Eggerthellaceae bacterium]|nr:APC family permease [Eggerthellaceae bacterium]
MSTFGVVAIVFSFVAAGAFGIEEAIASCGPGITLALLLVFPIVWSFPLCEMVGELGSLLPSEGGIYVWAKEAFGEFWGWQAGFWGAVTTWLCQAEFITLATDYLGKLFEMSPTMVLAVKICVIVLFTIVNIVGLKWTEKFEIVIMVLVIVAFGAIAVIGFMHWQYNPFEIPTNLKGGLFHSAGEGVAVIIWMYLGYECMSNMAGELENPQIIPRAMRIANPVIALSYILPTLAALAAIGSWSAWSVEPGLATVGYDDVLIQYVGAWAGVAFIVVAVLANCSIFCAHIAEGSRMFFVMAEDNMFPKFMGKLDRRGVPAVSILVMAVFTVVTCQFDFVTLVMATNAIQFYMYMLMVACVIKLRKRYPVEERRKVGLAVMPGGNVALYVSSALVVGVCLLAIYLTGLDYFMAGFVLLFFGLVCYVLCKWRYKGCYREDPKAYPLSSYTRLGLGDLRSIGVYATLTGVMALLGAAFVFLFEHATGVQYYLAQNGRGFFGSFYAMLAVCVVIGIVGIAGGAVACRLSHHKEGSQLAAVAETRNSLTDARIKSIHGFVPRPRA